MRTVAAVVALIALATNAFAFTIARDGTPVAAIVVGADANVAEQHAATELADYLGQIAGCEFAVAEAADGPAIYVGPTDRARAAGIDADALDGEE